MRRAWQRERDSQRAAGSSRCHHCDIASRPARPRRHDGVDGAGKTTFADALAPLVIAKGRDVIRASVDDFHNPRDCWDVSVFLYVDFSVSMARNAAREQTPDAADQQTPSYRRYVGGQQRNLAECAPQQQADIVIDYNDFAAPKIVKWSTG